MKRKTEEEKILFKRNKQKRRENDVIYLSFFLLFSIEYMCDQHLHAFEQLKSTFLWILYQQRIQISYRKTSCVWLVRSILYGVAHCVGCNNARGTSKEIIIFSLYCFGWRYEAFKEHTISIEKHTIAKCNRKQKQKTNVFIDFFFAVLLFACDSMRIELLADGSRTSKITQKELKRMKEWKKCFIHWIYF